MANKALSSLIIQLLQRPEIGTEITEKDWESIIFILRHLGMLATLYYLAQKTGTFNQYPTYAKKNLKSGMVYADRQAQQVKYEAYEIKFTLGKEVIEPIFLKGAGYTLRKSLNSYGRVYSDLDILVPKNELEDAAKILNKHGWLNKALTDHDEKYYREWAHEIPPMSHYTRNTTIDVHHNIIPPVTGRAPKIDILLKQVERTSDNYLVLTAPAAFLHSAIHLFTNEEFHNGFRDIVDLYLLAQEYQSKLFWQQLDQLAQETRFSLELFYSLAMLAHFFDIKPPSDLLSRLHNEHKSWRSKLVIKCLKSALKPHHQQILSRKDHLLIFLLYLRGHWIKMPLPILISHLSVKAFLGIRDKLFGKHQFDKELKIPHN